MAPAHSTFMVLSVRVLVHPDTLLSPNVVSTTRILITRYPGHYITTNDSSCVLQLCCVAWLGCCRFLHSHHFFVVTLRRTQQRPMQLHNSGLQGRASFPPQGPPGPPDAWGPGPRPGPPGGAGGTGGPHQWFDGPGAGPPHMYPPGVGQNMPPPPGVGHGRGGDMERWNGDR